MYSCVIFDLDGTLLDTLQDLAGAGNHALTAMGLPTHPVNAYRQMVGNGIPMLVQRMLPPHHRGQATQAVALDLFSRYYAAHMEDLTRPYPGILPLLAELKTAGVTMAVLSNKGNEHLQKIVPRYFPGIFAAALGLCEDFPPKPHAASTLHLMQLLDADPTATLYCGDSDVDMQTAKNAGLPACGVLWGFRDEAELQAAGADFLVPNATALRDIILDEIPD